MPVNPPRPAGPPLNSLRAFEAAARYNSFVRAADELCVTPGAVAQQIKILESWAGDKLFDRHSRGISLTSLGKAISGDLNLVFDQLGEVVQKLRVNSDSHEIRITTLPSIAQFWVMPMLPAIRKAITNTSISVIAVEQPPNMQREPFDISLFFKQKPDNRDSMVLLQDEIFPVCSPGYQANLNDPKYTRQPVLIHDAAWNTDWNDWLAATNELDVVDTGGPVFSLYSLAVEETLNGGGLLMGHPLLINHYLESGKLVTPFKTRVTLERYLNMDIPESSRCSTTVQQVAEHIRQQAATHSKVHS